MISILGYVCFYPNGSALEIFGKVLKTLLKDKAALSGYVLSTTGKIDIRKKSIKKDEVSSFFFERFNKGFNELVVRGQFDSKMKGDSEGKIHLQFIPSSLDSIWEKFGDATLPKGMTDPVRNSLMGLASKERFANLNNITEYPNIISIALECDENNVADSYQLQVIGELIAIAMQGVDRWAMALDAGDFIPRFPTNKSLAANPDTVEKMDRFFLVPHLSIGGNKKIIDQYVSDLESISPNLNLLRTSFADAEVVTVKNWADRGHLFVSKWHENPFPNPVEIAPSKDAK